MWRKGLICLLFSAGVFTGWAVPPAWAQVAVQSSGYALAGASQVTVASFDIADAGQTSSYLVIGAVSETSIVKEMTFDGTVMTELLGVNTDKGASGYVQIFGLATTKMAGSVSVTYSGKIWGTQIFGYAFLDGVDVGVPVRATGTGIQDPGTGSVVVTYDAPVQAGDLAFLVGTKNNKPKPSPSVSPSDTVIFSGDAGASFSGIVAYDANLADDDAYTSTFAFAAADREVVGGVILAKAAAHVSFAPLPGQAFMHEETFDQNTPAGFNLSPTFVPYPHNAMWKVPGASQVVDGMLSSSNKNGAVEFDATGLFGPFGVDLKNSSVALYMRLWTDVKSAQPRVTMGFMNFAAEEAAPDTTLARYLGIYVRNSSNPMIGWGGKNDMDNQADGTGLQKQGVAVEGWYDYAVLLEGNGTSVSVSAFYKAIDEDAWTAVAAADGTATIDTQMGFDSRKVFFWTRDNANIWKIDEFAVSTCYLPVDDMESYDLLNPVWYTYSDGHGYAEPAPGFHGNGSGSMVDTSPAIKHADANSLALSYNNTGAFINAFDEVIPAFYSEVTRTFEEPKDWTAKGVDTLSIWFRGLPDNDPQPLYVVIEDSAGNKATVTNEDPAAALKDAFTEWPIALTGVAGVDLTSVKKLTLGVGDKAAMQAGGKGTVYFDDLGLYKGF